MSDNPTNRTPAPGTRTYKCPWCQHAFDASSTSCPACGAPVDVAKAVTQSGWSKQPPIKDMAKIQFGESFCQIEGNYVPVADFKLGAGDGVYFSHHVMLWKDDGATITVMPMTKGWTRMLAGLPLIMTQAAGPGRIAFSKDKPGEMVAVPLEAGQSMDVREHGFVVATSHVAYAWFSTGIWFDTRADKSSERHYPVGMIMDRFTATNKAGLLLLHGEGNVFVRQLEAGQTILLKPKALLYKDPSVRMNLHFEHSQSLIQSQFISRRQRHVWIRLTGPGRVAVQSEYEPVEDPGTGIVGAAPLTTSDRIDTIPTPIKVSPLAGCVVFAIFFMFMMFCIFSTIFHHRH